MKMGAPGASLWAPGRAQTSARESSKASFLKNYSSKVGKSPPISFCEILDLRQQPKPLMHRILASKRARLGSSLPENTPGSGISAEP